MLEEAMRCDGSGIVRDWSRNVEFDGTSS